MMEQYNDTHYQMIIVCVRLPAMSALLPTGDKGAKADRFQPVEAVARGKVVRTAP
jgi:hypothetical protein